MRQTACELLRAFIFVPSVTLLHGIVRDILLFLSVYFISSCDCCSCIRRDLCFITVVVPYYTWRIRLCEFLLAVNRRVLHEDRRVTCCFISRVRCITQKLLD